MLFRPARAEDIRSMVLAHELEKVQSTSSHCPFCRLLIAAFSFIPAFKSLKWQRSAYIFSSPELFGYFTYTGLNPQIENHVCRFWATLVVDKQTWSTKLLGTRYGTGIQLLADPDYDGNPYRYFQGRKINPVGVSMSLLTGWLDTCMNTHLGACEPEPQRKHPHLNLCFIDVLRKCVVKAPATVYFALSYTWGDARKMGKEHLQLRKETSWLREDGALADTNPKIPQTIKDAILLTELLGKRYLWVDALCIQQDDKADRMAQIAHMGTIYSEALLTICAAAGSDANAGLPGLRTKAGSRYPQYTEIVKGMKLVTTARPYHGSMRRSTWDSRAWVYQEKTLSKRLLIFTEHQAFFRCARALWYEDCYLEGLELSIQLSQPQAYGLIADEKPNPSISPYSQYISMVRQYGQRHISRQDDALNAFSGVIQSLKPSFNGTFLWAMPESYFDSALRWTRMNHFPRRRRRGFPSWSWLGWKPGEGGSIEIPPEDKPTTVAEIIWFILEADGTTKYRIQNSKTQRPAPSEDITPTSWWKGSEREDFSSFAHIQIPRSKFTHILYFWTSSAFLTVDRKGPVNEERFGNDLLDIRGLENESLSRICLYTAWRRPRPDHLEFIVVSRDISKRNPEFCPEWKSGLNLMLVEWVDKIAYRVQIAINPVAEEQWVKLDPVWKPIMLG